MPRFIGIPPDGPRPGGGENGRPKLPSLPEESYLYCIPRKRPDTTPLPRKHGRKGGIKPGTTVRKARPKVMVRKLAISLLEIEVVNSVSERVGSRVEGRAKGTRTRPEVPVMPCFVGRGREGEPFDSLRVAPSKVEGSLMASQLAGAPLRGDCRSLTVAVRSRFRVPPSAFPVSQVRLGWTLALPSSPGFASGRASLPASHSTRCARSWPADSQVRLGWTPACRAVLHGKGAAQAGSPSRTRPLKWLFRV